MSRANKTKRLAVCAAMSALGVVVITIGSFLGAMDMSMAVIASLFCVFAVIEYGKSAPWLVYAVTSALSVILIPENPAAWLYLAFFGYYPIIKEKLEKKKKWLAWLLKEVIFNVALAVLLIGEKLIFLKNTEEPWYIYLAVVVLAEIAFPLYDVALTRIISLYIHKLRARFRLK